MTLGCASTAESKDAAASDNDLSVALGMPPASTYDHALSAQTVADTSWAELSVLMRERYGGLVAALRKDSKTAVSQRIPAEDRFVAAYAFISENKSSDAWMLLAAPGILPKSEDLVTWKEWTASAVKQMPSSMRLRYLHADALARTSLYDESLRELETIAWPAGGNPTDRALALYLKAHVHLLRDPADKNAEGKPGNGPARSAFYEAHAICPLSAIETDLGYYFLTKWNHIPNKAEEYFDAATAQDKEPDCMLANAGLARTQNDEKRFVGALGTFSLGETYSSGFNVDLGFVEAHNTWTANTFQDNLGGVYSLTSENINLREPLTGVWSTLVISPPDSNDIESQQLEERPQER
jgi:hypothetical protein